HRLPILFLILLCTSNLKRLFKKTERQINRDIYQSLTWLDALLALFVFFIGVFLVIYLLHSHGA
ncbi:MAG: hypothetical protein M3A24_06165, partial [Candidatus Rhabdochlamydia oedothoracis]|nr:hypothetical protein [Candidatus Rhabdochlamydia oedothoracis]